MSMTDNMAHLKEILVQCKELGYRMVWFGPRGAYTGAEMRRKDGSTAFQFRQSAMGDDKWAEFRTLAQSAFRDTDTN